MTTQAIVVGMDFGEPSVHAARWIGQRIAPDADLVLVHAIAAQTPPSFLQDLYPARQNVIDAAWRRAEHQFDNLTSALGGRVARVMIDVGRPDAVLVRAAEQNDAVLIAIAVHGEKTELWKQLGSTAERLVRRSHTAVLIARGIRDRVPEHVLLVLDDSPSTPASVTWAAQIAGTSGARVTVMFVGAPLVRGREATAPERPSSSAVAEVRRRTEEWIEQQLAGSPLAGAATELVFGEPGFEIDAAARRIEPDLLIMPRHGQVESDGTYMDATTEFIIRNGSCPVLVVARDSNSAPHARRPAQDDERS